ncbi:MAG TPA: type II toxin-antitoxin system death-on-curing family toxin [Steroidobacteraceae bacterium]|jgi:death-on-curing protein|nr:type II toxin-antitoxin system death-on-curing family toxin [Steroidobacteraceae bacterium]
MTEYLTTADALFFHQQLIERYGGAPGVRDVGALESALHRPQTGYYDTLIHEAAALLESLVQNHPFVDGNKRVAFAVIDVFLRINGFTITASSAAIYNRMIKLLEAGTFDMEHLVPWLQEVVEVFKHAR